MSILFSLSNIFQSSPIVCLEDLHVVEEATRVVAQLVRPQHRGQDLLRVGEEGAVADKSEDLLLLILDAHKVRLLSNGDSNPIVFVISLWTIGFAITWDHNTKIILSKGSWILIIHSIIQKVLLLTFLSDCLT